MLVALPKEFPLEAVQILYDAYKKGDFTGKPTATAAWNIVGFGIDRVVTDKVGQSFTTSTTTESVDQAFKDILKMKGAEPKAIEPGTILIIVKIAFKALKLIFG